MNIPLYYVLYQTMNDARYKQHHVAKDEQSKNAVYANICKGELQDGSVYAELEPSAYVHTHCAVPDCINLQDLEKEFLLHCRESLCLMYGYNIFMKDDYTGQYICEVVHGAWMVYVQRAVREVQERQRKHAFSELINSAFKE